MNGGYEDQNIQCCERMPPLFHQPEVLRLPFHTRAFTILGLSQRSGKVNINIFSLFSKHYQLLHYFEQYDITVYNAFKNDKIIVNNKTPL